MHRAFKGINLFSSLLKKNLQPGICAIDLNSEGISIARLTHDKDKPVLESCDYYPLDESHPSQQLKKLAGDHNLKQTICTSLLSRRDYQLLVMESPAVPKDERRSALRWRIKDLIEDPVTEITLDAFDTPPPRGTEQSNSVYVVVAKNAPLNRHTQNLLNADINLQVIDIVEMAQRNIASLLPDDSNGIALLSLNTNRGMITLSKAEELYLSRPLTIGIEQIVTTTVKAEATAQEVGDLPEMELDLEICDAEGDQPNLDDDLETGNTATYDHIALELQRSLDYYESNFRQAPIRKLYLAPTSKNLPGFSEYIKENLNMNVEPIDLNSLLECKTTIPQELQAQAFLAIGAALHRIEDEPGN